MSDAATTDGDYTCTTCGEALNIIGLVQHGCSRVLSAETLSASEQNTLMHVEARLVDHRGVLDWAKMNFEDQQNLKLFRAAGLIETEPLDPAEVDHIDPRRGAETMRVTTFTDAAWDLVRDCRQARAERMTDYDLQTTPDHD